MKKLLTLAALVGATTVSFAQGTVNFANSALTLISAGTAASPNSGPAAPLSGVQAFNYALFLAPSTTVNAPGQSTTYIDPAFQTSTGAGNVNSATTAGRMANLNGYVTTSAGTVDFLVRGWSANAGSTWAQALAYYSTPGGPLSDMWIGQSLIGNDIVLGGGATPATTLFGAGANQVGGFTMTFVPGVPEPTSMALAGLGAASLLLFRRRK